YQAVWAELARAGFEDELRRFEEVLETVQAHIRDAPLEDIERQDIVRARERTAETALTWLDERRQEPEHHPAEETRSVLGLGELIPPPPPPSFVARTLRWPSERN